MACARPGRRPTKHLITSWLLTIIGSTTPCLAAQHHHLRARRAAWPRSRLRLCGAAVSRRSVAAARQPELMIFGRKLFREIDLADQFLDSLKQDYREFSDWLATKTNDCARVSTDDQTFLIGNHQERASNSAENFTSNNLETHRIL
jgi:hypothetical protein